MRPAAPIAAVAVLAVVAASGSDRHALASTQSPTVELFGEGVISTALDELNAAFTPDGARCTTRSTPPTTGSA
ncbi:MAG: hypothetical protein ACREMV_01630 [Gemmatimonadales bacterium]